jgi:effector-binding domain-containing protein
MTDFKLVQAPATTYLYVTRTCSMDPQDISSHMGTAFQQVWAFMQANSIQPAGGALSVYYDYSPDKMTFRAGFIIAPQDASRAQGEVKADATPAAEVIYFQHKGSYASLRDDYGLMMAHIAKLGREIGAPTWEVYLNDPDQVTEAELLTDVYSALK